MEDHLRDRHRLVSEWQSLSTDETNDERASCSIALEEANENKNRYADCLPCKFLASNSARFIKIMMHAYHCTSVDIYFLLLSLLISLLIYCMYLIRAAAGRSHMFHITICNHFSSIVRDECT